MIKLDGHIPPLISGGIGVMPTDTIYGIVGSALNKEAVGKIYELRKRDKKKPMIILIGDMRQATWGKFGIRPDAETMKVLKKFWPGKVSAVMEMGDMRRAAWRKKWKYLHRGTNSLAFRLPKPLWLRKFILGTGPLVAPSANLEGEKPARTIKEAKKYFGDSVDFYIDKGRIESKPSKLVAIKRGRVLILRA